MQENGPNIQGLKGLNKFSAALVNQRRAHFPWACAGKWKNGGEKLNQPEVFGKPLLDTYKNMYPTALRAIPATVPRFDSEVGPQ